MQFTTALLVLVVIGLAAAFPKQQHATHAKTPACNAFNCRPPSCRCSTTDIPGDLNRSETPQFVLLTFDDGVTVNNIDFYRDATKDYTLKNPDGCPAAMTFFLSHEYTDYELVHRLYSQGHEIAMHSISHEANITYWAEASVEQLRKEFADERELVARFANISAADIKGIRMPFLQMAGNAQFEMLRQQKFTYDLSWPTRQTNPGLWPYTLDYASTQDCVIGKCPSVAHAGVWVIPMLIWNDTSSVCSMVDTCTHIPEDKPGMVEFMKQNFFKSYKGNKAPIGFYTHAALFNANPLLFEAYKEFVSYLADLKDVYLVGASHVIDWVKNPKPVSQMTNGDWSKCRKPRPPTCNRFACSVKKNGSEDRWFTACMNSCPNSYPWIDNKYGDNKPS